MILDITNCTGLSNFGLFILLTMVIFVGFLAGRAYQKAEQKDKDKKVKQ